LRFRKKNRTVRKGGAAFVVNGFGGMPTPGLRILVRIRRSD
jgi:hypothetical protein